MPRLRLPTVPTNSFWIGERACKGQRRVEPRKSIYGFVPPWVTLAFRMSGPILSTKPVHSGFQPAKEPTSVSEEPVGAHGTENWIRLRCSIGWPLS